MRQYNNAPKQVPVMRKRLGMKRIEERPGKAHQDEWAIDEAIYEEVVDVVRSTGLAFERAHKTSSKFKEPELRDMILILLNGTFEGAATGELFTGEGKADIVVKVQDRAVFVGECKFWRGEKEFPAAIDQLLGYTVWRDTKASLILFIHQKNVTEMVDKADGVIRGHPCYKREGKLSSDPQSRRNYVMHQKDDPNREINMALLPFAIRTEKGVPPDEDDAG